jgi:hypothetical protein
VGLREERCLTEHESVHCLDVLSWGRASPGRTEGDLDFTNYTVLALVDQVSEDKGRA